MDLSKQHTNRPAHDKTSVPEKKRVRHTKIVATLGPASSSREQIYALVKTGMNVARINGSHGDHATHAKTIGLVREVSQERGKPIAVLFDLQGPKIRVGKFEGEPVTVKKGDELILAVGRKPKKGELPSDYDLLDKDVTVGDPLLIDDGNISTTVIDVTPGTVRCTINNAGVIRPRKGINLPKSMVSAPAVTDKDKKDALFAVSQGVDMIALSFVRCANDIQILNDYLAAHGHHKIPIIAKIEKPQALDNLNEILEITWGVMVARGDLGVELSPEDVPMAQKRIIRASNAAGKPVITATQMLESMTNSPRPTRAEASDVANAVLDGTDAVMLSAETATGNYPVEAVHMMTQIIRATEKMQWEEHYSDSGSTRIGHRPNHQTVPDAITEAACDVAFHLQCKAMVAFTQSGSTALLMAKRRMPIRILAFTPNLRVRNLLAVVWGVHTNHIPFTSTVDERIQMMDESLLERGLAKHGDPLTITMGAPTVKSGTTSMMLVHRIGEMGIR